MSDEEGETHEIFINASGDDNESEEAPWQIQDLHDLLSLKNVEEYTVTEFQHILALNAALGSMSSYYEAYVKAFNDIHTNSQTRGYLTTSPFSEEFYYSLPTPIEELTLHVYAKANEMQRSGRFLEYDFEKHDGILSVVPNPQFFTEPVSEVDKQKMVEYANAAKDRQDRYNLRGEAFRNKSHLHLLSRVIIPTTTQRSTSSAEDEAEQFRKRMIQTSGQLLPQTPIRGNSPMLGNFTSMSSPGGLGNLSYGGGSIPQLNTQYSL